MRARRLAAAAAFGIAFMAGTAARADELDPVKMVRSLQILQDQIAEGSDAAMPAQTLLLAHIAEEFQAADPKTWTEPGNARAALVYVLSGGRPEAVRKLIDRPPIAGIDPALLKGVLAYSQGKDDEARTLLAGVDLHALPHGLAAQVALVQGVLLAGQDPAKAIALFDTARLLMPGTLIEESALRREIAALGAAGNLGRFERLSIQYMRRFQDSGYASSFRQDFADLYTRIDLKDPPAQLPKLDEMLGELRPDNRRSLYLLIARRALVRGELPTARYAADRAAALIPGSDADKDRAVLYAGAAAIGTDDFARGLEMLDGVKGAPFDGPDAGIRRAALGLAEQVRRWPAAPDAEPAGDPGKLPDERAAIDKARAAVAGAEKLLADAPG